MTETDPAGAPDRPTAGEVGMHRQEPGTATPESAGPSLNVPEVHAPPKPYVKPVVSHGKGDPLAGLSETPRRARPEVPRERKHEMRVSEEDRLRDEIVRTREDLGRTVEALAQKVDVKARAQQKMAETKVVAREKASVMAERLRGAASHSARAAAHGTGTARDFVPGTLRGVADQISRRPAVLIAVGAATMAGAGLLSLAERRARPTRRA
ncbi:DUF3618 domain-containing protein [Sphaerisporangium sp. NPDC088356]|uniref:DUF3618 domain-containing protein n=1 Tax=Sphaerisporangium sp. NPDC088356 TaxID=3154871 RepID=UPI0034485F08